MAKNNLTRRQFLTTVGAGAGTVLFGSAASSMLTSSTDASTDPLRIITLGNTGIKTTLLGMGTGFNGYNHSSAITRAGNAESMIRYAWDRGIRFFDCADAYGTHPYIAKALKDIPREKYTLSTKIMISPEPESQSTDTIVDRFRKELKTDYIDIVQIHYQTSANWTVEHKKHMDILETLKSKGIIKTHGVSIHSLEALETAAASPWVDIVHVRINSFGASMDSRDPAKVTPVIEKIHKSGKGVIGMKLIGGGNFRNDPGKIDRSLKFVLGLGTVDLIIIGFEHPEQVDNYLNRIETTLKII
jgi:aryl-alcohol dehydrogenase-like predicted oxidoreductase